MKRLLIVLALIVLCIGSVGAISSNFQTVSSIQGFSNYGNSATPPSYYYSPTGGNSYMSMGTGNPGGYPDVQCMLINSVASGTTYFGITLLAGTASMYGSPRVSLLDSSYNILYVYTPSKTGRIEMNIVGGQAYFYIDGLLDATSGILSVNPSYIAFGSRKDYSVWPGVNFGSDWDDVVYGNSDPKSIFGAPDESTFVIFKDVINPSSHGIAYAGNHTIITSTNMTTTFGRTTLASNASANVVLRSWSSPVANTNYGVYSTGNAGYGTISWPIYDDVINNPNAPYGEYYTTVDGSDAVSNTIAYIAGGATVAWDARTHSSSDKATISYAVSSGGYWDTATYSYKIAVANIYGQFQGTNTSLSAQTGNATFQFTPAMNTGIYYAELIATPKAGGADILMNYDYTTLNAFVNFHGYVNNAQTGAVISGANVSMVQSGIVQNVLSATDGNYTAGGFITGTALTVNATGSGYRQYQYSFTPLVSKTVSLNISLVPSSPTFSLMAIGGVDRDTVYGQPIAGARVTIRNLTTSEAYYQTTSFTGWYLCDAGATCTITSGRQYDVWGSIAGWANSTVYAVVPA